MATSSPFGNESIGLEKNKVIILTKRTVRFARNIYQTHNISRFAQGEVDIARIHWRLIILVLFFGVTPNSYSSSSYNLVHWLLTLAGVGGTVWNLVKPKYYGLLITLNSGEKKLFITTDKSGLKQVLSVIYDFLETERDATYQISITNSQVKGNFIQGDARDVLFNSDQD